MLGLLANAVVLGSLYLLFALGLSLSWGVLNVLNLAHGSIFMFGAFSAYLLVQEVQLPLGVLLLVAVVVGAGLAVALQVLVYRPLQRRSADEHSAQLAVLIASIGASLVPVSLALNLSDTEVSSLPAEVARTQVHVLGSVRITTLQIAIVVIALLLTAALVFWVGHTQSGRALRTIAWAPGTANLLGIPVARLSALTMAISGGLAGGAGLLLAANANAIEPHMGDGLLLKAFAVVVLGGVGSVLGAAFGAFALAFAETLAVVHVSGESRDAIAFVLILVVLLVRPQGLVARTAWQRA